MQIHFSQSGNFTLSRAKHVKVPTVPQPPQHLLMFVLLTAVTLAGVRWYRFVVSICISLMANDAKHLFLGFLAIYISFLQKYLLQSFGRIKV